MTLTGLLKILDASILRLAVERSTPGWNKVAFKGEPRYSALDFKPKI
jgi:hypothetical protein